MTYPNIIDYLNLKRQQLIIVTVQDLVVYSDFLDGKKTL